MKNKFRRLCLPILVVTACGCFQTTSQRVLQNKFAFPNSDLTPLGAVSAEESHFSLILPREMDKARFDELSQTALKQKGGDTLVDYVLETHSFFPIIPLVWYQTFRIDGTAVKVVKIGRQELH